MKKKILVADIEANHYDLDVVNVFHCLGAVDKDTRKEYLVRDIDEAIDLVNSYDKVVFHNGIWFDVPCLEILSGKKILPEVHDTLIMARTLFPHPAKYDLDNKIKEISSDQSLKSWGIRLDNYKGDYAGPWDVYSDEMGSYCLQDCRVTLDLYEFLLNQDNFSADPIRLEHKIASLLFKMHRHGTPVDEVHMRRMYSFYTWYLNQMRKEVNKLIPPKVTYKNKTMFFKYTDEEGTTHMDCVKKNLVQDLKDQGVKFKQKDIEAVGMVPVIEEFNPCSAEEFSQYLTTHHNWTPTRFSPKTNKPIVKDEVLDTVDFEGIEPILEYRRTIKFKGFFDSDTKGWFSLVKDGRIFGRVNHIGTPHSRCSHYDPNLAQVPSRHMLYGPMFRKVFIAEEGYKFVGWDASSLQLRCLAHWLAYFDKGEYAEVVSSKDVHEYNRKAAGIETRDKAKTFIYALLFGAQGDKIGGILNVDKNHAEYVIYQFKSKIPALLKLENKLLSSVREKGYFKTIDGRPVYSSYQRLLLNYLLTSTEAVLMKKALTIILDKMEAKGYKWGEDYYFSLFVHDELQANVKPHALDDYIEICKSALPEAGKYYKFKCPLAIDIRIGDNWNDTHG